MSRKGENIYQRKDGRWEGRCIKGRGEDRRYLYEYVYADTYQEVKERLIMKKSKVLLSKGQPQEDRPCKVPGPAPESVIFRRLAENWLAATRCRVRESTYIKYRNLLNSYILPELGDKEWNEFSQEQLEIFCRKMRAEGGCRRRGLSSKTVSDILSVIRGIARYASGRGLGLPCEMSPVAVKKEAKEMRVLTEREQETLCRFLCANLNDCSIGILICMFTGLRLGEICALRWEDVSLAEQTIYVHQTMQRIQNERKEGDVPDEQKTKIIITAPKSHDSIRRIPVPKELAEILAAYRGGKKGYVLTGQAGRYVEPRTMERHFARILAEAGIERVHFHTLRHTFATRCVERNFDMKSLSEILGHANVNITLNRYVHPSMELKRKNMQKLSDLLAVS